LFRGEKRIKTLNSNLEHALVAVKGERWFGMLFSAEWPKARPRPSSHNQGIVHFYPPDRVMV
jgi:hypothetical protein